MYGFHYVYTLESVSSPDQIYTGQTQDLKQRLRDHNSGHVFHTSKSQTQMAIYNDRVIDEISLQYGLFEACAGVRRPRLRGLTPPRVTKRVVTGPLRNAVFLISFWDFGDRVAYP